jgi:Tfp pilus assembly protein PilN
MKHTTRVAIGIDVAETEVSMVALKRTATGHRLLDAARAPIPEGSVANGRVMDVRQLVKALRGVRRHGRWQAAQVAVSLPIRGTLTRIVSLEEQDPQRIGQFIRDEIKQYAILSGQETVSDFRILTAAKQDARGTALVAATDHENVLALTTACRLAGLTVNVVEPTIIAVGRAFCVDKSSSSADEGRLLGLLKDGTLTLYVFRRGLLDFIRTEPLNEYAEGAHEISRRVAEQIDAVLRFYTLRNTDAPRRWRVELADDERPAILPAAMASLQLATKTEPVSLVTRDHLPQEVGVDSGDHQDVSLTALGLAMRSLGSAKDCASVNLLPSEVIQARSAKRNVFIAANALAILMLTVVMGTGALAYMGKRVNQNIVTMRQKALERGDTSLPVAMAELAYVKERSETLSAEVDYLARIRDSHVDIDWVRLLEDVRNAVPAQVRLTELSVDDDGALDIEGVARSSDAVRAFAEAMSGSDQVERTMVAQTGRDRRDEALISYQIQCSLFTRKDR